MSTSCQADVWGPARAALSARIGSVSSATALFWPQSCLPWPVTLFSTVVRVLSPSQAALNTVPRYLPRTRVRSYHSSDLQRLPTAFKTVSSQLCWRFVTWPQPAFPVPTGRSAGASVSPPGQPAARGAWGSVAVEPLPGSVGPRLTPASCRQPLHPFSAPTRPAPACFLHRCLCRGPCCASGEDACLSCAS